MACARRAPAKPAPSFIDALPPSVSHSRTLSPTRPVLLLSPSDYIAFPPSHCRSHSVNLQLSLTEIFDLGYNGRVTTSIKLPQIRSVPLATCSPTASLGATPKSEGAAQPRPLSDCPAAGHPRNHLAKPDCLGAAKRHTEGNGPHSTGAEPHMRWEAK